MARASNSFFINEIQYQSYTDSNPLRDTLIQKSSNSTYSSCLMTVWRGQMWIYSQWTEALPCNRIKSHVKEGLQGLVLHLVSITWLSFLNSTIWKMCFESLWSSSNFGSTPKISHFRNIEFKITGACKLNKLQDHNHLKSLSIQLIFTW